jgi:hypothetical protein
VRGGAVAGDDLEQLLGVDRLLEELRDPELLRASLELAGTGQEVPW